ncbi:MAG: hypothetical protein E7633_07290 [Ruminococcaceae bacterium]|nr:hypothetical protein [Oscillospiraceae bacterium]
MKKNMIICRFISLTMTILFLLSLYACNNNNNLDQMSENLSKYALETPVNLSATPKDSAVTLTWDAVEGADGYRIYEYREEKGYVGIKFSGTPSKTFSNLKNGIEYKFAVASYVIVNGVEIYSSLSEPVCVTPVNNVLTINNTTIVIKSGETFELYCRLYDIKQNMKWVSKDPSIASIDENGFVLGISQGVTKIIATSESGKCFYCTVYVDRKAPEATVSTLSRYSKKNDGTYTNEKSTNSASIILTGDLMATSTQHSYAKKGSNIYDFSHSFSLVRDIFSSADLVIGNLEMTLSQSNTYANEESKKLGVSNCNSSPMYLDALKYAGYDALVTANNHTADSGAIGIIETIENLERYNFIHTGSNIERDSKRYSIIDVNGIKVALFSYNSKTYNGKLAFLTEDEQSYMLNHYDKNLIKSDIDNAKLCGAEFIIFYIHFGTQNSVTVTKNQLEIAQYLADCGVDFIAGSHPHILQKYSTVTAKDGREVPVIYSLGNFCSSMEELETNRDSIIFCLNIKKINGRVVIENMSYIPCYTATTVNGNHFVIVPIQSDNGYVDTLKIYDDLYIKIKESFDRTIKTIGTIK